MVDCSSTRHFGDAHHRWKDRVKHPVNSLHADLAYGQRVCVSRRKFGFL